MDLLTLVARLTLNTDEYQAGLKQAKVNAKTAGQEVGSAMAKATGAGAVALAAFAGASVKTGAEFDKSMSQVAATLGKTMDELQEQVGTVDTAYGTFSGNLREYAQYMGKNTAFSASQAADALNYMALAGYDAQTSMNMLPNVLNLAASGNMDLATASDMVTDAASALNLTLEDGTVDFEAATKMVDQMAMASSKTNTSVSQLGEAILTVGGTATYMKGGTKELTQVLGLMADNGIKGSEAGTHLRNMLLKLSSPTKEGAEWIEKLGLHIFDAEGNMRSFSEIFPELNAALDDYTDEERLQIMSEMFNARDIAAVNALLSTNGERWEEVGGYIDEAAGSAEKMAETQLDNLSGDITILQSAFEGLQIQIADKMTPILREVVQWITGMIGTFSQWAPIVAGLAATFVTLTVALNFSHTIGLLTGAFSKLWLALSANPIGVIIALIAGLVVAIKGLWDNNEAFRKWVLDAWAQIKEGFSNAFNSIANGLKVAGEKFDAFLDGIRAFNEKMIANVKEKWETMKASISTAVSTAFQNVRDKWDAIKSKTVEIFDNVKSKITGVWDSIKTSTVEKWESIKNSITEKIDGARQKVHDIIEKIKGFFNFNWSLPQLKLPHVNISGGFSLIPPSAPKFDIQWYKKAYDSIVEFSRPTVLATASGYKGFGDGNGSELVMSKDSFFSAIDRAGGKSNNITINVYPSAGMDEKALAEMVETRLASKLRRDGEVFA